ncbi:hypothetical protein HPB50_028503 [Hyalomma asiaticum]|nr:hypothetical protein HPB50_028503 [Hyalomma asiaticum]
MGASKRPEPLRSGEFEPEPPEELLCGICHDVLCEAVECPCRHVFCLRCIASQRSCPLCQQQLTEAQLIPVLPLVNKMISKLQVKCPHRALGCTLKVPLGRLNEHTQTCQYKSAVCESCTVLAGHTQDECPKRLVRCSRRCHQYVCADVLDTHDCQQTIREAMVRKRAKLYEERSQAMREVSRISLLIRDIDTIMTIFLPETATSIVLHVGTNDLCQVPAREAFQRYRALLDTIACECPNIKQVYPTLILPRSTNRRLAISNRPFVERCNREACFFNNLLRRHCREAKGLFFINHGFEWLPSCRVLAADGLHPNFDGVALIASHLHQTLNWSYTREDITWRYYSTGHTSDRSAQTSPAATPTIPPVTGAPGPESGAIPKEPRYNLRRAFSAVVQTRTK